jgi:hypothetical protein
MDMKIPQNIREKLPEDFDDNWDPIEWKDIKVMDYISYFAKARKYVHGQYAGKEVQDRYVKGGYVSFIPDEGKAKIAGAEGKNIIGFRYGNLDTVNRGKAWSVDVNDVHMFFKSKKGYKDVMKKGIKKAVEGRAEKQKVKTEVEVDELDKQLAEVEEIIASKKRAVVEPEPKEPAPKRPRGRPKKNKED